MPEGPYRAEADAEAEETHLIRRGRSPDQEAREQAREPPVQVLVHPGVIVRAEAGIEQPVSLGEIVMRACAEARGRRPRLA